MYRAKSNVDNVTELLTNTTVAPVTLEFKSNQVKGDNPFMEIMYKSEDHS